MDSNYWKNRFEKLTQVQKSYLISLVRKLEDEYTRFVDDVNSKYGNTTLYTSVENLRVIYCMLRQIVDDLLDINN